ncbi:hypothetical protein RHMOL_Rhmol06G0154900 [Rhododendron molle]|uniref:Uncharacterized protein n=1 Tax=Rhododendron molle TaxID=49168 RepID=A0ACC0NEL1_RHOML|nr:hypothetical protein RHMOL_Rhmol06G0154900 [Rhododendron molle]
MRLVHTALSLYMLIIDLINERARRRRRIRVNPNVYQEQIDALNRLVNGSDTDCHDQLRVNRYTFMTLCHLLTQNGLEDSRNVTLVEKVAIFLWILSHHTKNRRTHFHFIRSGETISWHFNAVLIAVLRLHNVLWHHPQAVPANEADARWKWFENCLGALDGTFVPILPPTELKARYRSRKGDYATNVLGVCNRNLQFIYALSSWEGSATDSRVLRNALVRPHGLRIPQGRYYLVDAGYTNGPELLAPYRGQRYHINIWRQGHMPQSREECFNMKHSSARNIVERCFGVLKMRWGILRSYSFYPIRTQCRIVTACCLLHNLIKRTMPVDPVEAQYTAWEQQNLHNILPEEYIMNVETTNEWTDFRDNLATQMYNDWFPNIMETQGTSKLKRTNGKGRKDKQTNANEGTDKQSRRLWTNKEEDALLGVLLDVFTGGKFKAENGFKAGFYNDCEKHLLKILPGTDLRAKPNIESKVKYWKANPKAKGMNGKDFPMFDSWQILFGLDRATGEMAEDAAEVENCDPVESSYTDDLFNDCYTPRYENDEPKWPSHSFVDLCGSGTANPTTPPTNAHTPTSNANLNPNPNANPNPNRNANANVNPNRNANANVNPNRNANANPSWNANALPIRPKKKAKKEAAIHEQLGNFLSQSTVVFEKIADAVGYEKQLSSRRERVFDELLKLDMDEHDRYTVNAIIVQAEDRMDTFYGIPAERKQRWVELVLAGKFYGKDK